MSTKKTLHPLFMFYIITSKEIKLRSRVISQIVGNIIAVLYLMYFLNFGCDLIEILLPEAGSFCLFLFLPFSPFLPLLLFVSL